MTTGRPVTADVAYARQRIDARPRGLSRFVDGRFGLDRILAATAATPEAMHAIQAERVAALHDARDAELRRVDAERGRS